MKQNRKFLICTGFVLLIFALSTNPAPTADKGASKLLSAEEQAFLEENGVEASWNGVLPEEGLVQDIIWINIADALSTFGRSSGGVIGDFFYVFGGQGQTSLAMAYQISTDTWMTSTPGNYASWNAGFCVANGSVYRISGSSNASTAERFDPDGSGAGMWSDIALPPTEFRTSTNGCGWDGGNNIYIVNADYSTPANSHFARYSISGDSWETLTPPTEPRRYVGLVGFGGYMYLIGGLGPSDRDPTVCQKYDPATDTWSLIASHPDSLSFTNGTTIVSNSYLWTVGSGGGYGTYPAFPHVHYYDPVTDTWTAESDLPVTRGLALADFDPLNTQVIHAGGNFGGGTIYQLDGRKGTVNDGGGPVPGTLSGDVMEQDGVTPISGVTVTAYDGDNNPAGSDNTDGSGAYQISLIEGTYTAEFSKAGYRDTIIYDLIITSGEITQLTVLMTESSGPACEYTIGDVNGSNTYNGLDITYGVSYFKGSTAPVYECDCPPHGVFYVSGDVNGSCSYNGLDITFGVAYFKGGSNPVPCPDCPPQ